MGSGGCRGGRPDGVGDVGLEVLLDRRVGFAKMMIGGDLEGRF